jgi:T-complex protein 1 subunit gamma
LANAMPFIERKIHPIVIIAAFRRALEDAEKAMNTFSIPIDVNNEKEMNNLVRATLGTKFVSRWSELMCSLALKAVRTVTVEVNGKREVDIKRYARVEKVSISLAITRFSIPIPYSGY